MMKTFIKLGIEGNILNLIKCICENLLLTSYFKVKHELFPLILGKDRDICSPLIFNIVLKVSAIRIRQGEKSREIETEEGKSSLFTDDMIVFLYRNIFLLRVIYGNSIYCRVKKHEMPKTFTLKTAILPREVEEDLNKWRVIIFMNWNPQYWYNNSSHTNLYIQFILNHNPSRNQTMILKFI